MAVIFSDFFHPIAFIFLLPMAVFFSFFMKKLRKKHRQYEIGQPTKTWPYV